MVSRKTVTRMSVYRRLLISLRESGAANVYSHQLAKLAEVTAAQVRRDLMAIGYTGSPNRGYEVDKCLESIGAFLDAPTRQDVVLVGVGKLGRSVLAYFAGRRPKLSIVAAFDNDPDKVDRVTEGCHCFPVERMEGIVRDLGVRVAVLTVSADAAQEVADTLVAAGVNGIVSFAPTPLHLPDDVHVEYMDIIAALESAAYFARLGELAAEAPPDAQREAAPVVAKLEPLLARADMRLEDLATRIGATVLTESRTGAEVTGIYAGDRVSDLLNHASEKTLLVSNLASVQMVRVAELMDVPAICFVNGAAPDDEVLDVARQTKTVPHGLAHRRLRDLWVALPDARRRAARRRRRRAHAAGRVKL